jgi:hypothetical protein
MTNSGTKKLNQEGREIYDEKLTDNELMDTIAKEQSQRKWNGFILLTSYFTMNKYSKTSLTLFKSK